MLKNIKDLEDEIILKNQVIGNFSEQFQSDSVQNSLEAEMHAANKNSNKELVDQVESLEAEILDMKVMEVIKSQKRKAVMSQLTIQSSCRKI